MTELKHYGVKGMKWGVIRKNPSGSPSADHILSRERKRKKLSQLSNHELRGLNERLQLERSNRDLQSRGAIQKIKAGTAIAGTVLAVGTTVNAAIKFTKSPAGQALKTGLEVALKKN